MTAIIETSSGTTATFTFNKSYLIEALTAYNADIAGAMPDGGETQDYVRLALGGNTIDSDDAVFTLDIGDFEGAGTTPVEPA